jgi:gas vesicle protein
MISDNWKMKAEEKYTERNLNLISMTRDVINEKIKECDLTKEELKAKLDKEENDFNETTRVVNKKVVQVNELLEKQKAESKTVIQKLVKDAAENIRANIYRVADSGVTDGDDLTQVFNDYQVQEFGIANDDYIDFINEKIHELSRQIEEFNKILEQEMSTSFMAENFYKKQQLKWEKGLNAVIKIGGAIGGIVAGLEIGAAIGTAVFPGFGTIVGVVAGALIGIIGGLIGSKSQKLVTAERAREVKQQIAPIIDDLYKKMVKEFNDSFAGICDNVSDILDEFCSDRLAEAKQIKENNIEKLKTEYNSEDLLRELKDDLNALAELEGNIHA